VREAAMALDRFGAGCVLVTTKEDDHEKVIGIVAERGLVRRVLTKQDGASEVSVKSIMSSPLVVVDPNMTIEEIANVMERNRVRRLPVVDEMGLAGVVAI
jgi:CBS domain-containing protein